MSICSTAASDPRKRVTLTLMNEGIKPIFVPVLKAFKALGVGQTQGWDLVKKNKIRTIVRNGRRLAVVESVEELAEEWMAGESPPPPRKGLAEATAASLASPKRKRGRPRKRPAGEADGAREACGEAPAPEVTGISRTANKPTGKAGRRRVEAVAGAEGR
jgi:hypothetical protein